MRGSEGAAFRPLSYWWLYAPDLESEKEPWYDKLCVTFYSSYDSYDTKTVTPGSSNSLTTVCPAGRSRSHAAGRDSIIYYIFCKPRGELITFEYILQCDLNWGNGQFDYSATGQLTLLRKSLVNKCKHPGPVLDFRARLLIPDLRSEAMVPRPT